MTPDEAFSQFKREHPESDLMGKIKGYHVTPYGICIDLIDNTGIPYAYVYNRVFIFTVDG